MSSDHIRMAFQSVKKDMMELKSNLLVVAERLERLESEVQGSSSSLVQIKSAPKKAAKKPAKKAAKKTSKKKK